MISFSKTASSKFLTLSNVTLFSLTIFINSLRDQPKLFPPRQCLNVQFRKSALSKEYCERLWKWQVSNVVFTKLEPLKFTEYWNIIKSNIRLFNMHSLKSKSQVVSFIATAYGLSFKHSCLCNCSCSTILQALSSSRSS